MTQIDRVRNMEKIFNETVPVIEEISEAIENNTLTDEQKKKYLAIQENIDILSSYYEGQDWKDDFDADCDGMFPPCLERGVLSEDLIYDLLTDNDIIKEQLD